MSRLFIDKEHLQVLIAIFDNYCPNATIYAYGSRLNGDAHSGSDLDLAVKDFGDDNCSLAELKEILSQSNIPFLVDISEFNLLPESFREEILKGNEIIYPVNK